MAGILFLSHRIPFPPNRGDKIRSHHLLKRLAHLGPVHVGTFAETDADRAERPNLANLATTHCLRDRRKPLALAGIEALASGKPFSLTAFHDARLARWVARTVEDHGIDTIFVFSGQMGQYVPADFAGRVVLDLCDVDSAKFDAYADAGERRWINRREARLLAIEERRMAQRAEATLLISEAEADLFRSRLGATGDVSIRVVSNGIDGNFFDPARIEPEPELVAGEGPQLVFTGQMDYRPNVEAILWAARELMPRLRRVHAHARLHVVGRAPVDEIRRLHGENGMRIWGEVPDVRPFLKAADIVVAPLRIARGVQNKVLEAMAMERAVVLTPDAATGIPAWDGEHFRIAPAEGGSMSATIAQMLEDEQSRAAMGKAARQFVTGTQSWDVVLAPLEALLEAGPDGNAG